MIKSPLLLLLSVCSLAATASEIDLAGTWKLSSADHWIEGIETSVPGGVYRPLVKAGKVLDPFFGFNEWRTLWVGRMDWAFERTFTVGDEILKSGNVILRLEDVDTFATFYVNGVEVGRTDDRFRRWDFDVGKHLKPGENTIRAVFESTDRRAYEESAKYDHVYPGSEHGTCPRLNYVRTLHCKGGWDWGLSLLDMGMMGTVKLIADETRIDYTWCEQEFAADYSRCTVTLHAEITAANWASNVSASVTVENPKLWWPNGLGEQNLTELAFDIAGRKVTKRIGLRKLETVSEPDGAGGLTLGFRVNGVDVFAKGANWIPCSAYDEEQTPARYRDLLESAKAANMNMIRLWGGGQFEKDCFYDLCDELGLLIWHDFMFACQTAPGRGHYLESVDLETRHQIKRLRDHASIALWCGDNECVARIPGKDKPDHEFFLNEHLARTRVLAAAVRACDPSRHFWATSPYGGENHDRALSESPAWGDIHSWEVWWAGQPFEHYQTIKPHFCSEFGYQSFSSPEVAETYCPEGKAKPGTPEFEYHQKNTFGNSLILSTMKRYFHVPTKPEDVLYLSQQQQALAIRTAAEAWRPHSPYCRGILFWQLNDNWPVASWSSIEYGGKWKALQYQAKRFFEPVAVMCKPDGTVWGVNDLPNEMAGELTLERWTFAGKLASSRTLAVALAANRATELAKVEPKADEFLVMRLRTDRGEYANEKLFAHYKDSPLEPTEVRAAFDGFQVTLSCDRPAFFVWANAKNCRGEFDDNSFTLLPGRPKTLVFTPKDPDLTAEAFQKTFAVKHLRETYE